MSFVIRDIFLGGRDDADFENDDGKKISQRVRVVWGAGRSNTDSFPKDFCAFSLSRVGYRSRS